MSSMLRSLRRKARRRTFYDLVLDDTTEAEAAVEKSTAERRLTLMRLDPAKPETVQAHEAADAAYDAASAALRSHVCRITFEQIPPHEYEALAAEHPANAEQLAAYGVKAAAAKKAGESPPRMPQFDPVTLIPALFARCVIPDDGDEAMTEAEWADVLEPGGNWQEAERSEAFDRCLEAIFVPRSVTLPKG